MARSLNTLIRVKKWELDEKRRQLSELHTQLEVMQDGEKALEAQVLAEQKAAAADPTMAGLTYAGFAQAAIQKRQEFAEMIAAKQQEIERHTDVVADAYKELKTTEISEENRKAAEEAELAAKETAMLDEIGTNGFLRRQKQ